MLQKKLKELKIDNTHPLQTMIHKSVYYVKPVVWGSHRQDISDQPVWNIPKSDKRCTYKRIPLVSYDSNKLL
jgi:hypothetical protein